MKITDIAPRRHRLSQLYINGEAAVKVDTETLLRRGIAIGDELDDEELHALLQASAKHRAEERHCTFWSTAPTPKKSWKIRSPARNLTARLPAAPWSTWKSWAY